MSHRRTHISPVMILACTLLVSSGCSNSASPNSQSEPSPTFHPTTDLTPLPTAKLATSVANPTSTSAQPTPAVLATLFNSLYALEWEGAIWRLDASSRSFQRVTPYDVGVISFAISPSDGTIAYGDYTGAISILPPGGEPRLLLSPQLLASGEPLLPTAMDFSNSGDRLAFAISLPGGLEGVAAEFLDDVTAKTGLWVMNLSDRSRTQLLKNQYPTPDNAPLGHVYTSPAWAPDDRAISLVIAYWENSDVAWLFPLGGPSPAALHDPIQQDWAGTAWAPDGSGLYLFGEVYDDVSNLDFADRTGQSITTYLDGTLRKRDIRSALPIGNSVLFAANLGQDYVPLLYLGEFTGGEFVYSALRTIDPTCFGPHLTAAADDATVLVSCPDSAIVFSIQTGDQVDLTALVQRDINPHLSRITFQWAPQP